MSYKISLKGKVILITGGYGYLGEKIVESLLLHSAAVYVLAKDKSKYEKVFENNSHLSNDLFFQTCDISSTDSIKNAFKAISSIENKIDVLINNAFYIRGQNPETMTDEEWNYGVDGTLSSVFRCIREIIPYLESQENGKIINVSSMYGLVAPDFDVYDEAPQFLNPPHYGAAKAGVLQLTRYYASYLGKKGITVNSITPGAFPYEKVQENEEFIEELRAQTSLGRIGKPEDLAGAFVFLASDAANYITGQNIVIDGGWTIK